MVKIKNEEVFEFGDFRFPGGLHVKDRFIPDLFDTINFERATETFFDEIYHRFNEGEYKIEKEKRGYGSYCLWIKARSGIDESWRWAICKDSKMWDRLDHNLLRLFAEGLFEELVDYHKVEDSVESQQICYGIARKSLDRAVRDINKKSSNYEVVSAVEKPAYWELGSGIGGEI